MRTPQTPDAPLGVADFRDAMALLAAPITVVTTLDDAGRQWGFTASAVISASLEPPLLLVGIGRTSSCHHALTTVDEFVVNLLSVEHRAIAQTFAERGTDRFAASGDFEPWPGSCTPYLPNSSAAFRCRRAGVFPAGDHDLVLGELVAIHTETSASPLLWYRRAFCTPGTL